MKRRLISKGLFTLVLLGHAAWVGAGAHHHVRMAVGEPAADHAVALRECEAQSLLGHGGADGRDEIRAELGGHLVRSRRRR